MKKTVLIALSVCLSLTLSACAGDGANNRAAASNASTVSQVLEEAAREEASVASDSDTVVPEDASSTSDVDALQTPRLADIDLSSADAEIDLTLLSGTMVYSQVSQMVYQPEEYVGKTVKMQGPFAVYEGEERNYYACIIQDATACCANGIEFLWAGDHAYPDDYPELGTEITVIGTFDIYEEDGFLYTQLADAQVSF